MIYKIPFNIEETALHIACKNNNIDIVQLLISHIYLDINLFKQIKSLH